LQLKQQLQPQQQLAGSRLRFPANSGICSSRKEIRSLKDVSNTKFLERAAPAVPAVVAAGLAAAHGAAELKLQQQQYGITDRGSTVASPAVLAAATAEASPIFMYIS
jgi:hypothetical protein